MYAPHVITLYNLELGDDLTGQPNNYNITILSGVLVDAVHATNVRESGLENADNVTVYIPFSVNSGVKTYLPEKEYEKSADKGAHWTLRTQNDFFIKGEVIGTDVLSFADANERFDDVYRISVVDVKDFGSDEMRHWEVGGK